MFKKRKSKSYTLEFVRDAVNDTTQYDAFVSGKQLAVKAEVGIIAYLELEANDTEATIFFEANQVPAVVAELALAVNDILPTYASQVMFTQKPITSQSKEVH